MIECPTYTATIFIAGDYATAARVCRDYCYAVGLCVTVEPTSYIYTGGEEAGVRVGLINYPRFPSEPAEVREKAFELANRLRSELCQHSWSVVTPDATYWDSRRAPETSEPTAAAEGRHRRRPNDPLRDEQND